MHDSQSMSILKAYIQRLYDNRRAMRFLSAGLEMTARILAKEACPFTVGETIVLSKEKNGSTIYGLVQKILPSKQICSHADVLSQHIKLYALEVQTLGFGVINIFDSSSVLTRYEQLAQRASVCGNEISAGKMMDLIDKIVSLHQELEQLCSTEDALAMMIAEEACPFSVGQHIAIKKDTTILYTVTVEAIRPALLHFNEQPFSRNGGFLYRLSAHRAKRVGKKTIKTGYDFGLDDENSYIQIETMNNAYSPRFSDIYNDAF